MAFDWKSRIKRLAQAMIDKTVDSNKVQRDYNLAYEAMDCPDSSMSQGHIRNLKRGFVTSMAYANSLRGIALQAISYNEEMIQLCNDQAVAISEFSRLLEGAEGQRAGRRWSLEEDAKLIELRAAGHSVEKIALNMGRSSGAIATRLSHLIGIRREVIRVNGKRIEGFLNDAYADGKFEGVVYQSEVR